MHSKTGKCDKLYWIYAHKRRKSFRKSSEKPRNRFAKSTSFSHSETSLLSLPVSFFRCFKSFPASIECSKRVPGCVLLLWPNPFVLLFWLLCFSMLYEFWLRKSALSVFHHHCQIPRYSLPSALGSFQGQYFSGGNFRIYLLGNPIVWWSNLAFLAIFLLTYFMAAIKQQRGYDADEEQEAKCEYIEVVFSECWRKRRSHFLWWSWTAPDEISRRWKHHSIVVTFNGSIIPYGHKAHMRHIFAHTT